MKPKKVLILLPDGVGLRNFAFTSFVEIGKKNGWEIIFWNHTPFNLKKLGYKEIKLNGRPRAWTNLLKKVKIEAELNFFIKKFNDPIYNHYKFPNSNKSIKAGFKNILTSCLVRMSQNEKGLHRLRSKLKFSERNSEFYKECKIQLQREKPDLIFCTNQRPVNALAPLTAARDLNIKTASFIFSWDNLPKATMIVDTDHYFVWSAYMKKEMLSYYPHIHEDQIFITGSPQFEPHFNPDLLKTKKQFYTDFNLDLDRKYICFSGDDITTSPDDPQYLDDLADSIRLLNDKGMKLGIIFRRCPTDFSNRYDRILKKHQNLIVSVVPQWKKLGTNWSTVLPTKKDLEIQINTIFHSEAVVNVGSSMVFDFAIFTKPCLFLNYEVKNKTKNNWSPYNVYNFIHFRSMPNGDEVYWLNSKAEIAEKLVNALSNPMEKSEKAKIWLKQINKHPADKASERIWDKINQL